MEWVNAVVIVCLPIVAWFGGRLLFRLIAPRCPECGCKWGTEMQSEWGGEEDWKCYVCGEHFTYPYRD